ncbi:hypothetical protein [Agriterribacter sp.]|uniref:hypothetical protein n=1 Tax=Agriterribacter sp. TaxID=2821509 RepID=UPI002B66FBA4|nr:hypothetical protein [Agriterribacter sp.]HRO46187.1 hypothetical protein [Agriterribacter sp.]HRQ16301.1 hypothetical protein [Agriterribacter sp.]
MSLIDRQSELLDKSLGELEKLKSEVGRLEEIRKQIEEAKKGVDDLPKEFEVAFNKVVEISKQVTESLGLSTKTYLDGNNTLFTEKLKELSTRANELQREILRLANTDLNKLFHDLQNTFIEQLRKDLSEELKKIDSKSQELQRKIDELKRQVERLESVDLDKYFDKLQKTLSEIFGAINGINITLASLTRTLTGVVQMLGTIQNTIDSNHKEVKQVISSFREETSSHLSNQDNEVKRNVELLESKTKLLAEQNDLLKKEVKTNRTIQVVLLAIILSILIYVAVKQYNTI